MSRFRLPRRAADDTPVIPLDDKALRRAESDVRKAQTAAARAALRARRATPRNSEPFSASEIRRLAEVLDEQDRRKEAG
jgi:hypothetical protein